MTNEELLARATGFELISFNRKAKLGCIRELQVERTSTTDDPKQSWRIRDESKFCLNHDGEWEYEPFPSSRDKSFLERCRWSDLHEAIAFAETHMEKYPTGYKPEGGKRR